MGSSWRIVGDWKRDNPKAANQVVIGLLLVVFASSVTALITFNWAMAADFKSHILSRDENGMFGIPFKRLLFGGIAGGFAYTLCRFALPDGAISNRARLNVAGSTFTNNTATENGGAVYHQNANAQNGITQSCFTGNTARFGDAACPKYAAVAGTTDRKKQQRDPMTGYRFRFRKSDGWLAPYSLCHASSSHTSCTDLPGAADTSGAHNVVIIAAVQTSMTHNAAVVLEAVLHV